MQFLRTLRTVVFHLGFYALLTAGVLLGVNPDGAFGFTADNPQFLTNLTMFVAWATTAIILVVEFGRKIGETAAPPVFMRPIQVAFYVFFIGMLAGYGYYLLAGAFFIRGLLTLRHWMFESEVDDDDYDIEEYTIDLTPFANAVEEARQRHESELTAKKAAARREVRDCCGGGCDGDKLKELKKSDEVGGVAPA